MPLGPRCHPWGLTGHWPWECQAHLHSFGSLSCRLRIVAPTSYGRERFIEECEAWHLMCSLKCQFTRLVITGFTHNTEDAGQWETGDREELQREILPSFHDWLQSVVSVRPSGGVLHGHGPVSRSLWLFTVRVEQQQHHNPLWYF